ncbi:MAG: energy transducer TonB [Fidelibacterota bacterium]|nr:MAG: energy transducer TonB [Candidatus Neomarinimicrobiota bacterium]
MIRSDVFTEKYPQRIRWILLGTVLVLSMVFYVFPRFSRSAVMAETTVAEVVETFDIPPTQQLEAPPPPSRPSIPVEAETEEVAEDITIEETTLESFAWDVPPPPPTDEPIIKFIPYDEPPEPIGGLEALMRNVRYPPIAREAGIEGTVVVQAFIDDQGRVTQAVVAKGMPGTGLDEAAVKAIKGTRFKPAKQRDRAVGVWLTIPIMFKLLETSS